MKNVEGYRGDVVGLRYLILGHLVVVAVVAVARCRLRQLQY